MNDKIYRTEVRTDSDYDEIPEVAEFAIGEDTAKEIAKLAAMVKEHGLHKVEKFDYRTQFCNQTSNDEVAEFDKETHVRTDADTLCVSETEFWFSSTIKHTNVEILTERQSIADLLAHFGIGSITTVESGAKLSVPVKYWDFYNSEDKTAHTHQFNVQDHREAQGQVSLDLGAVDGELDDLIYVLMEVNTNPLNNFDHVPCIHVHFDADNLALSLFKIDNKILLRMESQVTVQPVREVAFSPPEAMYWIE